MPISNTDALLAFGMKNEEASEFLRQKGLDPQFDVSELKREYHAHAFTSAKVMAADILQDLYDEVNKALDEGATQEEFNANLKETLSRKGWWGAKEQTDPLTGKKALVDLSMPWRLDTIFRTNMQNAYMAGRLKQQALTAEDRPYYEIITVQDRRRSSVCKGMEGRIFRVTDPNAPYPPFHYRCRTRTVSLTEDDVARTGRKVEKGYKESYHIDEQWRGRPTDPFEPDTKSYASGIAKALRKALGEE